jgi:hypothetical protein
MGWQWCVTYFNAQFVLEVLTLVAHWLWEGSRDLWLATIPKLPAGGLTQHSYQVLKIRIGGGLQNIYIYLNIWCITSSKVCKQPVYLQENENKYDSASRLSDCHHSKMSTCDTSSISLQMSWGHFGHWWLSDLTFWCHAGIQWMLADIGTELMWHWTQNVSWMPHLNGGVPGVYLDSKWTPQLCVAQCTNLQNMVTKFHAKHCTYHICSTVLYLCSWVLGISCKFFCPCNTYIMQCVQHIVWY